MSNHRSYPVRTSDSDMEPTLKEARRWRQRTFIWQRQLMARPHKPARSDTDD